MMVNDDQLSIGIAKLRVSHLPAIREPHAGAQIFGIRDGGWFGSGDGQPSEQQRASSQRGSSAKEPAARDEGGGI